MSEVVTLGANGSLLVDNFTENSSEITGFLNSIGRVYNPSGAATGFVVGYCAQGPLLLTCRHAAYDVFELYRKKNCIVCFEKSQFGYSFRTHNKCGVFFRLKLLKEIPKFYSNFPTDFDPITNVEYVPNDDFCLFVIESRCRCGNYSQVPALSPIPLSTLSSCGDDILIIGYPGPFSYFSAPLKDLTKEEITNLGSIMQEGNMIQSKGKILAQGSLYAVSNPTIGGFSGSPILKKTGDGSFVAIGIFIGGVALPEHRELISISDHYIRNQDYCLNFIQNSKIFCRLDLLNEFRSPGFIEGVKYYYNQTISHWRKSNPGSLDILNHNLGYPIFKIYSLLENYNINLQI
jgi:hypothetical protein